MAEEVALTIDGKQVTVPPDTTLLAAARQAGVDIPHLCYDPALGPEPTSSCRLCLVDVEGAKSLGPACSSLLGEGTVVRTDTEELRETRRMIIDLLLSDHPQDCLTCETACAGELKEVKGSVVVIGGGNTAVDSARTALRLGASPVTILYRRTREEMPAIEEEIEEAILEGVDIRYLLSPIEVRGGERVRAVRCAKMRLGEADDSGRRRPVATGEELTVDADHVIVAIGRGAELDFAPSEDTVVSRGRISVDNLPQRSGSSDVFAGGDAQTGPATIVEAIGAGQRAARAIDMFLGGSGELRPDRGIAPRRKPDESEAQAPRQPIEALPPEKRRGNFKEVLKGYSLQAAYTEARRCLRCDLEKPSTEANHG